MSAVNPLVCVIALSTAILSSSDAFMIGSRTSLSLSLYQRQHNNILEPVQRRSVLYATEEEETVEEEAQEDVVAEEGAAEETAEEEEEAEEAEEEEDPEVKALKDEISELESSLKRKRRQLRETQDTSDRYTKSGYARKVAEMENMRRARSMLQSSDQSYASAEVLKEFLPVLDELNRLKEKYDDDEFGKQYGALPGALRGAFTTLGVTDYTVTVGEKVDALRMIVVDSEHCEDQPADTVLRPLKMGLELQGNVVLPAECVASLGPEVTEEEEEAAEGEGEEASEEEEEGVSEDRDVE